MIIMVLNNLKIHSHFNMTNRYCRITLVLQNIVGHKINILSILTLAAMLPLSLGGVILNIKTNSSFQYTPKSKAGMPHSKSKGKIFMGGLIYIHSCKDIF